MKRGDNFVVDNCSIHMKGDISDIQDYLLEKAGVLMVSLTRYWAELNSTELAFHVLVKR